MGTREMIYEVGDKAYYEYITPFENWIYEHTLPSVHVFVTVNMAP